jgi:MFS family permease
VLRAAGAGLPLALAPLVLVAMSLVYGLGAYPAGALADRRPARTLLAWGLVALVAADALLAWGRGLAVIFAGIGLWGAHMALTQGLLGKLVADAAPARLRGSAFGLFNLATGCAMLVASVLAGFLWDAAGPRATFVAGGGFAALALLLALLRRPVGTPRPAG